MSEERPKDQPLDRMMERPDLGALRESHESPTRSRLRMERFVGALGRSLTNRSILTMILAVGILLVLIVGYMQLN